VRTHLGILAMSLLLLAPCGSFAKDPALLSLGMEHFRDTASVDVDPAAGVTTISTEPGFVERSGLLGMVWHDEFLTAVIDAKTGRTSYRIDVSVTYSGARRTYRSASLAGVNGSAAIVPTLVRTQSANCAVSECMYTDHLVIPVDEALLRHLAAGYVPGKPAPLTYTLTPKRGADFRGELSNAEIAGLLAKVDGYSAAPKAAQEALPSPRRLDFGISGIVVSPSSDRPDRAGVLVAAVSAESVAHQAGIITGDIICQVGDRPTRSLADLEAAVAAIPAHASAAVRIYRGLKEVTLSAKF
jgi:hypothetical protein